MSNKVKVLFTKKLESSIKILEEKGILYDAIDFIKVKEYSIKEIDISKAKQYENHIFTSKNAVFVVNELSKKGKIYCVGGKVANFIKEKGFSVDFVAKNALELCGYIKVSEEKNWNYFCGNKRLNTIPQFFLSLRKNLQEIICYETELLPNKLKEEYNAYVFFSPSGVESFFMHNSIAKDSYVAALGSTTAKKIEEKGIKCNFVPDVPDINKITEKIKSYYAKE